jgi:hypothetical protein
LAGNGVRWSAPIHDPGFWGTSWHIEMLRVQRVGRVETRNTAKYGDNGEIRRSRERNTEYGNTGRGETRKYGFLEYRGVPLTASCFCGDHFTPSYDFPTQKFDS